MGEAQKLHYTELIRRGREAFEQSYDRDLNDLEARVEQDVVIVWDPCPKSAVLVNLCDEYCGSAS